MKQTIFLLITTATLCYNCGGESGSSDEIATDTTEALQEPLASVMLEEVWKTDTVLRTPESVLFDPENKVLYVSNINEFNKDSKDGDGFISKVNPNGSIETLQWVSGLNDPKGMGLLDGKLYVADLDEIVEINLSNGKVEQTYPVEGAAFLNDITVDSLGNIYISDTDTDKLHILNHGKVSAFMADSSLQNPNGVLITKEGEFLVASAGGGFLAPVNTSNKMIKEHLVEDIPSADGVVELGDGSLIVSTWPGEVYYVEPMTHSSQKIMDTKAEKINSADIGYDTDSSYLLIPTFYDNRVVAYKIQKENS